jgi:hypothetical protein
MIKVLIAVWLGCATETIEEQPNGQTFEDSVIEQTEIGPVTATIQLSPKQIKLGDPIQLQLEVLAQPNVEIELPPFGEALGRFQISNFQPRERINDDGSMYASQTYTLQAPMSGLQRVPSLRVIFRDKRPDKESEEQEILTEEISVMITGLLEEDAPLNFQAARGSLANKIDIPLWLWGLGVGLPLLGFGWVFRKKYTVWKKAEIIRNSYEQALESLLALQQNHKQSDGIDIFYAKLSMIVRRYLEARFGLHAPELTTQELLNKAQASSVLSTQHQLFLKGFLERCDAIKFAQALSSIEEANNEIHRVRTFLEETRPVEESA